MTYVFIQCHFHLFLLSRKVKISDLGPMGFLNSIQIYPDLSWIMSKRNRSSGGLKEWHNAWTENNPHTGILYI